MSFSNDELITMVILFLTVTSILSAVGLMRRLNGTSNDILKRNDDYDKKIITSRKL